MTVKSECRRCPMLLAGLLLALIGCQPVAVEHVSPGSTESMLAQAGFQRLEADTPERLAQMAKMQQTTLVGRDHDGRTRWVYADAKGCGCLYLGGEEAYKAYAQMLAGEEKAEQAAAARTVDTADSGPPQPDGDAPVSWNWDDVPWYDALQY
jgi:hypothetical protein